MIWLNSLLSWRGVFALVALALSAPPTHAAPVATPVLDPAEGAPAAVAGPLDGGGLARAMLAAGGASGVALDAQEASLTALLAEIERQVNPRLPPRRKAQAVFRYLHRHTLRRYDPHAAPADVLSEGRYNCVSATALFFLAAERLGVPVGLYVTPVHMFAVVDPEGEAVRVEMTEPRRGFAFHHERSRVIRLLLEQKMVTREDVEESGEEAVYRMFVEDARPLAPERLPGVVLYNVGVEASERGDVRKALEAFAAALRVDPEDPAYRGAHGSALLWMTDEEVEPSALRPLLLEAMDLRRGDTSFAETGLLAVERFAVLAVARQSFDEGAAFLGETRERLSPDERQAQRLDALEAGIHYDWAVTLLLRGRYAEAYERISNAHAVAPGLGRTRELRVHIACEHARRLGEQGDFARALELIRGLEGEREEFSVIGETYARIAVYEAKHYSRRLVSRDPQAALELLKDAFAFAPEVGFLRDALAGHYHELAMEQVRARNYPAARALVREGLELLPGFQFLVEDLELIEEHIRARRR